MNEETDRMPIYYNLQIRIVIFKSFTYIVIAVVAWA